MFNLKQFLSALTVLLLCLVGETCAQKPKPNILFFLVDDMGIMDTSVPFLLDRDQQPITTDLNRRYRTPNMERLAQQGMKFTQAYAYSVCSPTRVSLICGQNAARHHVTTWTHPASANNDTGLIKTDRLVGPQWRTQGVNRDDAMLPDLLRRGGYRTLFAGKAHFGPDDTPNGDPLNLGFDVNIAGYGGGGPGGYHGQKNYSAVWRGGGSQWDVPGLEKYHGTDTFLTEAITLEMMSSIEAAVEMKKPFFSYMSHYAVHAPFETDDRFKDNYPELQGKALAFATLVEGMDKSLGDLLNKLDELGVAEETLVIFMSDNGSDGIANKPLRGKKGCRHEGGLRVPLMVAWAKPNPDHPMQKSLPIQPASVETDIVSCVDLMPTMLSIGGVDLPDNATIDGYDLTPYLSGNSGSHRPQKFISHFPHGRHNNNLFSTLRQDDWKIIYSYQNKEWELYNLNDNVSETENLIGERPQLAQRLATQLVDSLDQMKAQYPVNHQTGNEEKPDLSQWRTDTTTTSLTMRLAPFHADNQFVTNDFYNWGGSIIQGDDDLFYMFYSRWPRDIGFLGWLTHSQVAVATSTSPSGPWEYQYTALQGKRDGSWNSAMAHNPKIKKFGDKYYLYYISTPTELTDDQLVAVAKTGYQHQNWPKLRNAQRIGVATSHSILGPWKTQDQPLLEPDGPVHTLTVNPAVTQMEDGRFLMVFKGDKTPGRGQRVQAVAISEFPDREFKIQPRLAIKDFDTEDVSLWYDENRRTYFATYHAHTHFGLIESRDGAQWQHLLDFEKAFVREDGQIFQARRMERPFVFQNQTGDDVFLSSYWNGEHSGILTIPIKESK